MSELITETEETEEHEPFVHEPDDDEREEEEAEADEPEAAAEAPPVPEGITPEELERRFREIEKAWRSYTGRVTKVFEEEANDLTECPLCAGGVNGFVAVSGAGRVPDEVKAIVQDYLGVVQEADYPESPNVSTCRACNGLGKVRTGSRVPQWATLTCEACRGHGFTPPPGSSTSGGGGVEVSAVVSGPQQVPTPPEEADVWGSPRLLPDGMPNPNYGRMPQYKDPQWP